MVTKDVPAYSVYVGNPAIAKKLRFPNEICVALQESKWWEYAPWQMNHIDFNEVTKALKQIEELKANEEPFKPSIIKIGEL